MDSEKLSKLCGEAKIRASKAYTQVGFALYRTTDKEKLQALKAAILCINDLGKIKEQIENEISITKEDATKELENIQIYFGEVSDGMYDFFGKALCETNRDKRIEYIEELLSDFDFLNKQRVRLEALRERLNLEEEENDNQ